MAKRGHGEGTVYEDKKRNRWESQVTYTENGETKRKKFVGKTRKEAIDKGKKWLQGLKDGLLPDADKITVGQWVDRWLSDYAQQSVRVKTYEKYLSCMKNYIQPRLKDTLLIELKAPDVQKLWNELLISGGVKQNGISPLTIRNTRRYFITALDKAVEIGYLVKNIARFTHSPKLYKQEVKPLNKEQASKLLEVAKCEGGDLYIAVYTALSTGMRIGEVMGLKWEDVNYKNKLITVKRSRVNSNHGVRIEETKTGVARKIPVHDDLLRVFQMHQKKQEWRKKELGDKYIENDWVVGGQIGNSYDPAYFSSRKYKPLLKKAGIDWDFTFHDLRHTHATLLLLAGVHPKTVQERLGHATIQMTLDTYSHLLPDTQGLAVIAIADFLTGQSEGGNQGGNP